MWPAEIGFLTAHGVPPSILAAAVAQAATEGVTPNEALLARGRVSEDFYYRCLARHLGLPFIDRPVSLGDGTRYPQAIERGLAPLAEGEDAPARLLLAPRGSAIRRLLQSARRKTLARSSIALTTPSYLSLLVRTHAHPSMVRSASHALSTFDASLSAARVPQPAADSVPVSALVIGLLLFCAASTIFAPLTSHTIWLFGPLFLGGSILRLLAAAASFRAAPSAQPPRLPDDRLPSYSIIIALRHEANIVGRLVGALEKLDYPRAKLDIKFVIEADDRQTLRALQSLQLSPTYEIIVAPPGEPRTKPRALNIALPLLRGTFVVVFDAEDQPDPQQIRAAATRFLNAPRRVACLQAKLRIDNIEQSWLTRLFAIEYAGLFEVVNPGIADLHWPLALGGTSNHFRIEVLREICGWDAWNMTEDADLGFRLARFGYAVETFESQTDEEAPPTLRLWFGQRCRWLKGWMQTSMVLARQPRRLVRELGFRRAGALAMMLANTVLAPLVWPFFAARFAYQIFTKGLPAPDDLFGVAEATLWISVSVYGLASVLWIALVGLWRRRLLRLSVWLPALFLYHLAIFAAAWRALYELRRRPYHWQKTAHGFSQRTERSAQQQWPLNRHRLIGS